MKLNLAILTVFSVISVISVSTFAVEHREHKAHQHGAAKIDIAFQGPNGQIDIEAPSEGVYGFEYAAKSDGDKKKQHDAMVLLETNINDMIQFDKETKCEISKQKIEIDQHEGGKHADIDASFKVICLTSPVGTTMTFNIQKTFPKLKSVNIQLIADDVQKSFAAKKDGAKLVLKK